ncbi:MAG: alpha-1,2-mannosidase [Prevotella sp. AG:487_50_53]|nr:MAG: alpha-1,2-mannosidase [Prevotella sp. AG:487_50_53]
MDGKKKFRDVAGCLLFTVLMCPAAVTAHDKDLAHWVNPFIGASTNTETAGAYHGLGKTFPGAATPYGMVQVSPQTITGGDNGSGYSYEHQTIEGFSMTQMSGVGWYGEMGNFLVMPTTGEIKTLAGREKENIDGWRSHYDKESEHAHAGYYSVRLTDYGIKAEATCTPRCGALRFTFPKNGQSHILIDLARRVGGSADYEYIKVVDSLTFEGWIRCTPQGGGWGNGDGRVKYTLYFHARLSKPMKSFGFWKADFSESQPHKKDDVVTPEYLERIAKASVVKGNVRDANDMLGRHMGFFADFATDEDEAVTLTCAVSYVDIEGARRNFEAEAQGRDFDSIHRKAVEDWNNALGCIDIEGGTEAERTIFYTALYHTMIDPRIYQDVDGRYVGGDYQVHQSDGKFVKRTVFSGWDVFRSQMPLQTIIRPQLVNDLLNSLITLADQSGRHYFERWELLNSYSGCMLGNPAVSVLADAWAKGIRDYDISKAYEYAKNSSKNTGNGSLGYSPGNLCLSHTLEYAYTDWCTGRLAEMLGKDEDAALYYRKGQAYRNIFDKKKGWFRPKDEKGNWLPWPKEGRLKEWYGCMECNPLQQGWFVPHDVKGMVGLMGGKKKVIADLDWMFGNTPQDMFWNMYYNHANEPVHFVPYLYNRLGAGWKTQYHTRYICRNAYENKVEGLRGNEDVGQMSAWYVLSAIGIHQYCPGDTRFEITSPVFRRATIHLQNGKTFTVNAPANSDRNIYIRKASLNGKNIPLHLDYKDIVGGGVLQLEMGAEPEK